MSSKSTYRQRTLREWWIFSFFILIAGLYWLILTISGGDNRNVVEIWVAPEAIPPGYQLKREDYVQTKLVLGGSKWALIRERELQPLDTLRLPGQVIKDAQGRLLFKVTTSQFKPSNNRLTLLEAQPPTASFSLKTMPGRTLPVKIVWADSPPPGYKLINVPEITPERFNIFGPEDLLKDLDAIYTEPIALRNHTQQTRLTAALEVPRHLQIQKNQKYTTIQLQWSTMITRDFLVDVQWPENDHSFQGRPIPDKVLVRCTLPAQLLENKWQPVVTVVLPEQKGDWPAQLPLRINDLPEFCTLALLETSHITYQLWP